MHLVGFYYKNEFTILSTDTVYNSIYSLGASTYIHIHSRKGRTLILKCKKGVNMVI